MKNLILWIALAALAAAGPMACGSTGGGGDEDQGGGAPGDTIGYPADAQGAWTIVTLGDSLTEGVGDSEWTEDGFAVGYPGRLEQRLWAQGVGAEVVNIGRSGWTSGELVEGNPWDDQPESQLDVAQPLLEAATQAGRDTVACLWIGSNDLFSLYGGCHAPDNGPCEAEDLAQFEANIDAALDRLTGTGATVYVALLDDQSLRPVLADPAYADSFPEIGAADHALMAAQIVRYNESITTLAAQYGAHTVDFHATTLFENPATLDEDGNHPNGAGYDIIAGIWDDALGL